MISDVKLRSIFNKLPIGYYLGKNVKSCILDESSEASYYNLLQDKVIISFKMVKKAVESLDENEYSDSEVESIIRGLLYHELGHVILSRNVIEYCNKVIDNESTWRIHSDRFLSLFDNNEKLLFRLFHDVVNIFEDERIETVLCNSFLNTNFKKNLIRLTNIDDYHDNNPIEKFFKIVRFRVGDPSFISRAEEILDVWSNVPDTWDAKNYVGDVLDFFVDVYESIDLNDQEQDNNQYDNEDGQNNQNNKEDNDQSNSNGSDMNDILKEIAAKLEDNDQADLVNILSQIPDDLKDFVEELLKDEGSKDQISEQDHLKTYIYNGNINQELIDKVNKIFNDSKTLAKKNSSAVNSYSGVFDPRSAGREDCRFFVNKSRNGSSKMYSKYNLNLYIDCSGSFNGSQQVVNELLYALRLAAKSNPNFSLNIATIGDGVHKFDFDDNVAFICDQGTALDEDIFPIVKSYTKPDAVNRSIVLIDGNAFECGKRKPKCFSAFNSKDFYLIVDQENEQYVTEYAPKAHSIIHSYNAKKSYSELLIERVLSALEILTRV